MSITREAIGAPPAAPPASAPSVDLGPPVTDPRSPRRSRVRNPVATGTAVGIAGLVALAVVLRAEGMQTWYWIDEALSVGIASEPLGAIPGLLGGDGSPPLYYVLLHLWMRVFGTDEVVTHALSLTFALAIVPVGFWSGRALFGRRSGWMVATLAATAPFLTYFARETRMYTLVALLALVVVTAFLLAFVHDRHEYAPLFVVASVALVYTHNWGLYTVFAAMLAMGPALLVAADRRRLVRRALLCFGAVGVAYLPWVPTLLGQLTQTGAPWAYTPTARELVGEISALVRDERVLGPLVLAGLGGLAPLLRRPTSVDGAAAWALGCFAAAPIAVGWAFAHVEPSWATRYLAVVVGPLILAVGAGMARAGGMGLGALGIALLLWVQPLARLETGIVIPHGHKSNARSIAAQLQPHLRAGDLVLVAQPEAVPLFHHYLDDEVRFADVVGPRPEPSLMDWREADEHLAAASTAGALQGIIDSIPPGGRLALILPANRLVRTDTDWIRRFHALGTGARRALAVDPRFGRLRVTPLTSARRGSPAGTFRFVLYERHGGRAEPPPATDAPG